MMQREKTTETTQRNVESSKILHPLADPSSVKINCVCFIRLR